MRVLLPVIIATIMFQDVPAGPDLRCGGHCLYVSLRALDFEVGSFSELESRLGQPSAAGYSMGQLDDIARSYGAETLGVETTFENLRRRPGRFACIALVDNNHFVNLANVDATHAYVVDPPRDYRMPLDGLAARWDGTALLISRDPLLPEENLPRPFPRWVPFTAGGLALLAFAALWIKRRATQS